MSKKRKNTKTTNKQETKSFEEKLSLIKNELPEGERETEYPEIGYEGESNKEIWKPLYGFEETHQISSMGRVKSLPRYTVCKDGITRPVKGTLYKIPDDREHLIFSFNGENVVIPLAKALGESFYGPGEYSLINSFEYYKSEDKPELYISLENISGNSAKEKISLIDESTGEEILMNSSLRLFILLNKDVSDIEKRITIVDLIRAKDFEINEFGITIKGIKNNDNFTIIVRKGSFYKTLLEKKKRQDVIDKGQFLDAFNTGNIWTGHEIMAAMKIIRNTNPLLSRFAISIYKRYMVHADIPFNLDREYVFINQFATTEEGKEIRRYKIISLHNVTPEVVERYNIPADKVEEIYKRKEYWRKLYRKKKEENDKKKLENK